MHNIVIFGASGFAREVFFIVKRLGLEEKINYFVISDNDFIDNNHYQGVPIKSESDFFDGIKDNEIDIIIAVASPNIRKLIHEKIIHKCANVNFPNIIDPSVIYDDSLKIGMGNIICSGTVLTVDICIKDFTHINLNCTVGHETVIGSFNTISPGCNISGNVKLHNKIFIGSGSVVLEQKSINESITVGAGTIVNRDLIDSGTYVGAPVRNIKK